MGIPKIEKHLIKGINQDISKSKFSNEYAYEIRNARLLATDSQTTFAVTNEKGNKEYIVTDDKGNTLAIKGIILGHCEVKNYIVLFTHQENPAIDRIYRIDTETNQMITILEGNMNFNIQHKIETIGWYESDSIIKVYWIDGLNQPRYVNIADGAENDINIIDFVPEVSYGNIQVSQTTGGFFTAGMVQYGYNLYRKYGAQSKLSGLSELYAITSTGKGYEKDTSVPVAFDITIGGIPKQGFSNIKLYRIHRTEYNSLPKISLIYDGKLEDEYIKDGNTKIPTGNLTLNYKDNGQVSLEDISLEQLSFLGSDFLIPNCIAQHSNRLIFANYKEEHSNLQDLTDPNGKYKFKGAEELDWDKTNKTYKNSDNDLINAGPEYIKYSIGAETKIIDTYTTLPLEQQNFTQDINNTTVAANETWKGDIQSSLKYNPYQEGQKGKIRTSFKRGEKYRFGIQFCDKYGQWMEVIHLADIEIPRGRDQIKTNPRGGLESYTEAPFNEVENRLNVNISANYSRVTFTLPISLCKILVQDFGIVRARIVRVKRDFSNSKILSQGILTPTIFQRTQRDTGFWAMPDYLTRNMGINSPEKKTKALSNRMPTHAIFPAKGVFQPLSGRADDGTYDNIELDAKDSTFYNPISIITEATDPNYCVYGDSSIVNMWSPEISFPGQSKLDLNSCMVQLVGRTFNRWTLSSTVTLDTTNNKNITVSASVPGYEDRILTYLRPGSGSNGEGLLFTYDSPTNNHKISYFRAYYGFDVIKETESIKPILLNVDSEKQYAGADNGTIDLFMQNIGKSVKYNSDIDLHYTDRDATKTLTYHGKTSQHIVFPAVLDITQKPNWENVQPYYQFQARTDDIVGQDRFTAYNGITYDSIADITATGGYTWTTKEFPIVELTRKVNSDDNQYGEKDNNNNLYIVCSKEVPIEYSSTIQKPIDIIADQGDIYLQRFNLLKSYITDTQATNGVAEVLSFMVESTIDLDRRIDNSDKLTDIKYTQPEQYYKFNEVYNQLNDLFTYSQIPSDVDVQTNFPNKIIASSTKTLGSKIDNATNILQNEFIGLDGQYGEIRKLQEFNSFMYGFQDTAVSYLIINPRVQLTPSDGVPIELGTGQFLSDKRYITTKSGTTNKWGICSSNTGIYYIDDTNSSINKITGEGMQDISTNYGFHSYMSNIDLSQDFNSFFHNNNDEIYFNFKDTESLIFSEAAKAFTEFMDITPNIFINYKDTFLTDHIVNNIEHLYLQFEGDYNSFYGDLKDSSITIISNENYDLDKTYDNIEFRSECYSLENNKWDKDVYNETYNYIHSWNERQNSEEVPLIFGNNLKERFRIWRTPIPRHSKSLIRMRNGWQFIKLGLKNDNNRKVILHDINVKYSI